MASSSARSSSEQREQKLALGLGKLLKAFVEGAAQQRLKLVAEVPRRRGRIVGLPGRLARPHVDQG